MKRKTSFAPLWACVAAIAVTVVSACHSTKPVQKSDQQQPAKEDTTKKIDTGPSEFFDGFIKYRTPEFTACIWPVDGIFAGWRKTMLADDAAEIL